MSHCFKFHMRTGKSHTLCDPRAQWTVSAPLCPLSTPAQFHPLLSDIWTPASPLLLSFLLGSSSSFVLAGQIFTGRGWGGFSQISSPYLLTFLNPEPFFKTIFWIGSMFSCLKKKKTKKLYFKKKISLLSFPHVANSNHLQETSRFFTYMQIEI